jgi:two-component system chemotaxis response regulator CheB
MNHDIVTIGASAGGIEPLQHIVRALPVDLPAAVFVVVHIGVAGRLVDALSRDPGFPVATAEDERPIEHGTLFVAPPDQHLLLSPDRMLLRRGPRENLARPAIDPLFRSAATHHGPRVVGVVLSGNLTDGTAGLEAIKRCGGLAVVQDPGEAPFPSMPASVLANMDVDHVVKIAQLPKLLATLTAQETALPPRDVPEDIRWEAEVAAGRFSDMDEPERFGEHALINCPECGGPLWELNADAPMHDRCYEGQSYTPETLLHEQSRVVEKALWSALRAHRERAALSAWMERSERARNRARSAEVWAARAAEHARDAEAIRRVLRRNRAE